MILRLPYGRGALNADLRELHCHELRPAAPRQSAPLPDLVARALDHPSDGPSLADLARGRRRVSVLVPDATRKVPLPGILPLLFERLARGGVETGAMTLVVACGTHPPADAAALADLLGQLPVGVRVVQHDAHDADSLVSVGTLPSGLPVRLNRAAVEAELLVAVSSVQHHYFAGFGGGPKLIFPGVAGYEETQANHSKVIDLGADPPARDARCEPGVLAGNPVAEEIAEAASLRLPDFALLLVNGAHGRPAWAAGGPLAATFPQACAKVRAWFEVDGGPFRRIVVSAGGYPTDHTLIQAHKALDAACRFAESDAEVLFVAACDGGAGSPAMEPFLADPRVGAIVARLAERYVQYGHTTLRLVEKTGKFRIATKTELPVELAERLGLRPVADIAHVLERWRREDPHGVVGLIAGPVVYPHRSDR
jgi:nickel-dependent lactate racemase